MTFTRPLRRLAAGALCLAALAPALVQAQAQAQPPVRTIAIAGWGPHPTLIETVEGFKKGLREAGFEEGRHLRFEESHVNFDRSLAPQMLAKLASTSPDLMLTVATPVSVLAAQQLRTRRFPLVFTPIADPVQARLVPSWQAGGPLITGSSVALDYDAVLGFFRQVVPELKRLGVLYDTGDDSSTVALEEVEKLAQRHGLQIVRVGMDNPAELPQRVQSAVGRVDALYPVGSGRIQQGAAVIASTANRARLPVLTTIPQMVQQHQALAALAVSFDRAGREAGRIAARLLQGEPAESLPAWRPGRADHEPIVSAVRLKALGRELPDGLKPCGCVVE